MSKIVLLRNSCKGTENCGICMYVCPKDLFNASGTVNDAGYLLPEAKDESQCTGCLNCMISCPDFAIVVEDGPSNTSDEKRGTNE